MLDFDFASPDGLCRAVAKRAREMRLAADLTQEGLAARSGVSLGSLKRFESSGAISLDSLARLAIALQAEDGFGGLFAPRPFTTMAEVLAAPPAKRKRGRKS
ncbi:helix-turn-helix domain-containing protein [Azospirillum melinis]|uniref:helix-turn-helix domain-containing protein n=1 Tax=Azospirillum melinis TaxID=328839 RepID=UPI00375658E7